MILPVGASSFKEAMKMGVEVYHNLKVGASDLSNGSSRFWSGLWIVFLIILLWTFGINHTTD